MMHLEVLSTIEERCGEKKIQSPFAVSPSASDINAFLLHLPEIFTDLIAGNVLLRHIEKGYSPTGSQKESQMRHKCLKRLQENADMVEATELTKRHSRITNPKEDDDGEEEDVVDKELEELESEDSLCCSHC
ncbi:hypothetical protein ADUPG1_009069 [Aduncisulcus paluster]|uniref:Uncharacterized protein n=1 Tax=Aduncisulcus paluster TaxID=2918883 RepID=A0ABQ5KVI8_9EUKA|nr:hypothetical protein ADUPG1_009069 [Aduncisulcus paluster]